MLEEEIKYFLDHKEDLILKYNDKVIVIQNERVIGEYRTKLEAHIETTKTHKEGTFLIRHCIPGI